ncbi:MAG TPA: VOC family protein [Nitrososphaerales archaeon]|nr:VOC family protein [Nitrososphaerales archaeon]
MIKETNVTVIVSDMNEAVAFYTETLGLELKARWGDEFAQVNAPGTMIALHPAVKGGAKPGDSESLSIGFGVDNLDATMAQLKKKGVRFTRVADDGPVKLAFFGDPDGNPLYLSQSKWG